MYANLTVDSMSTSISIFVENKLIKNAKQEGGYLPADAKNISAVACYNLCQSLDSCSAADYNFGTNECWMHSFANCTSHEKVEDECCDHFIKGMTCPELNLNLY